MQHHRTTRGARTILLALKFAAADCHAQLRETPDPFHVADPCPYSATGAHDLISSVGDVACCHCSKVFWL